MGWAADNTDPDIVFFLAGADPFAGDTLGGLKVSKSGLEHRDRLVYSFCTDRKLPLTITLAGGYAEDIADIVDIQFQTICLAAQAFGRATE